MMLVKCSVCFVWVLLSGFVAGNVEEEDEEVFRLMFGNEGMKCHIRSIDKKCM